jgi:carbon monoxide dehydrogenase subunit G
MSSHVHEIKLNVPIQNVWEFVSIMDQWAPLVPGYIEHEILNTIESTWKFKTDIGIMKKKIHLKVVITDWIPPKKVTFDLIGINEKFNGNGYFEAIALDESHTLMKGCLDITAEGVMAKMVNPILNTSVPELTTELTNAVGQKIEEISQN